MPQTDPGRIYIPVMKAFKNDNIFTGSAGMLRFRLVPMLEDQEIQSEVWYGEYCYEKSQIAQTQRFPLSEEGREALRNYLEALRDNMH